MCETLKQFQCYAYAPYRALSNNTVGQSCGPAYEASHTYIKCYSLMEDWVLDITINNSQHAMGKYRSQLNASVFFIFKRLCQLAKQ
jgi:hypothetical protein